MNPQEYEKFVCDYFARLGYEARVTAYSGDYGVDVFAVKEGEKLAVQAKMYGDSSRSVNRKTMMELHGAKDFFDCTKAVLVTNGSVMPDAVKVAEKLGIEIVFLGNNLSGKRSGERERRDVLADCVMTSNGSSITFEYVWEKYIIPLRGRTLSDGSRSNTILDVDWGKVTRKTSTGKVGKINIEAFRYAVGKLLREGVVTRDDINQNNSERCSSGVVLILSQVPFFTKLNSPVRLVFNGVKR